MERLLNPQQVAALLGVPVATLRQWRTHGIGPRGFRVGRHLRYRAADVEQWIADRIADEKAS